MTLRTHWRAWRRDVVAFGILCIAAVALGLVITWTVPRAHTALARFLPDLPLHVTIDDDALDSNHDAGPRTEASPWTYRTRVMPGQSVWVRNVVGPVSVEATRGDFVDVRAVKSYGRSDPGSVVLVATPTQRGLALCAIGVDNLGCVPGSVLSGSQRHSDVAVAFALRVPRGVRVDIATVSGAVRVTGASAPVTVHAVNGTVDAETSEGPVTAITVNGGVRVRIRGFADTGAVSLATVNGAVTAELPAHLDAVVNAATLHGRIHTDFPLAVSHGLVGHHVSGTVGAGGRTVDVHTVNGAIRLLEASTR